MVVNRALKILGFIIRNTKLFKSARCHYNLYFALICSLVEYGSVVWEPYLAKDPIRLERVQITFLINIDFKLNIHYDIPT